MKRLALVLVSWFGVVGSALATHSGCQVTIYSTNGSVGGATTDVTSTSVGPVCAAWYSLVDAAFPDTPPEAGGRAKALEIQEFQEATGLRFSCKVYNTGGSGTWSASVQETCGSTPCDDKQGDTERFAYDGAFKNDVCLEGCAADAVGVGITLGVGAAATSSSEYLFSGETCSASGGDEQVDNEAPMVENCITGYGPSGEFNVSCASGSWPTNCGTVNGELVCPESVPAGECTLLPGGSYICDADAPAGEVPTGSNGIPLEPDLSVAHGDGSVTNIYGGSTVQGSYSHGDGTATDVPEPEPEPGTGGDGSGSCDPETESCGYGLGGEVTQGEPCDQPPSCTGSPVLCAIVEQEFWSRCVTEPTEGELLTATGLDEVEPGVLASDETVDVGSFDDTGWGLARSCPADLSVSLPWQNLTVPISQLCVFFQLIGTLVLLASGWISLRIVSGGF